MSNGRLDSLGSAAVRLCVLGLCGVLAGCGGGEGPAATLVIDHVTLIDGTDAAPSTDMTVAIVDDRIVAVGPSGTVKVTSATNRIDATGMFLIPGLWDMHVHVFGYRERALPLFLANGVTTIRDVGGKLSESGYLRQETRFGRMLGPTVLVAGPTLDRGIIAAMMPDSRMAVSTAESGRAAVDSLARAGVDLIKVHSLTPPEAYFAILDQARTHRLTVAGHVPDGIPAAMAIDSGQRTIEHDWGIPIANSIRGGSIAASLRSNVDQYLARVEDRGPLGPLFAARVAARDSGLASYDSATAAAFAAKAASHDVWFVPTLAVLMTQARRNEAAVNRPPELRFAPKEVLEFDEGEPPLAHPTAADIAAGRERWERTKLTFRELVRAKAKFVAGTDVPVLPLVPGFSLHQELELLVEIGLSPQQALQAASRNAAQAMDRKNEGTIAVGNVADLVLLTDDPLAAIANTRRIETVVAKGRLLDRSTLDRMLRDAAVLARQR